MRRLIIGLIGLLMTAGGLFAQEYKLEPPKVYTDPDASTAMQWLMTAVFVVGCLVVAFKPAKRSNLG